MKDKRFSQIAKRIIRADRGLRDPQLMRPAREWAIGLSVAFLIFAIGAFWSAETYLTYRDVSLREGAPLQEEVVVYRESLVESALLEFEERNQEHDGLLEAVQPTVPEETRTEELVEPVATSTELEVSEEGQLVSPELVGDK